MTDHAVQHIPWLDLWQEVADRVRQHRAQGRRHLLTEDSVRLETILALEGRGVAADRLQLEYFAPTLKGGKVDLMVDAPEGDVIELKFPRDSRTKFSPDTMTMGEMVRDFLRVAGMPARSRWVVQVVNPRLERYLLGLDPRHELRWAVTEGSILELHPEIRDRLPKTARDAMHDAGTEAVSGMTVTARCVVAALIDDDLSLYAYEVDPAQAPRPWAPAPREARFVSSPPSLAPKSGARAEILSAVTTLVTRSGIDTVTLEQIVGEMRRSGSRYAESTVRTMVASHMCSGVTGPGVSPFADLGRVDRGVYRLHRS